MGFLDTLKSLQDNALKQYKKFANDSLRIGTMAGMAMVSRANGELKPEEMVMVTKLIKRDEDLQIYGIDKCINDFKNALGSYDLSEVLGEQECLAKINRIKDENQKKLLVAKVCAIGAADGDFDKNEKEVARKICNTLNISTSQFGL